MCVIYLFKKGSLNNISKGSFLWKKIERDFYSNNDGCGYSYVDGGKIKVVKSLDKDCLEYIINEVIDINQRSVVMLHFRIATGSKLNEVNTHPFLLKGGQVVFCHNGILNEAYFSSDILTSDTVKLKCMLEEYKVNPFNIKDEFTMMLFERFFSNNKLVFMNRKQEVKIINEELGEWYNDNIWVSYKENQKYGGGSKYNYYYDKFEDDYYGTDYDYDYYEEEKETKKAEEKVEEKKGNVVEVK